MKRDGDICVVKARITPEHNVRQKCYAVTCTCNETEENILSVQCEDCAAHLGNCFFTCLASVTCTYELDIFYLHLSQFNLICVVAFCYFLF